MNLLPCPFCGRTDFVHVADFEGDCSNCGFGKWGKTVVCDAGGVSYKERGCGANIGYRDSEEEAIVAWNQRPQNEQFEVTHD